LGPEGGRPGSSTQAVSHTCSGNLGIVKILHILINAVRIWQEEIVYAFNICIKIHTCHKLPPNLSDNKRLNLIHLERQNYLKKTTFLLWNQDAQ
jgi:hypothetical protein